MTTQVIDFAKEAKAMVPTLEYEIMYAIPAPINDEVVRLIAEKLMQLAHKAILEGEW